MTRPSWELADVVGERDLRLEYDQEHQLWVAIVAGPDEDEDGDVERVGVELDELLAEITDEPANAPWITALVDQIEADRRALRRRHRR